MYCTADSTIVLLLRLALSLSHLPNYGVHFFLSTQSERLSTLREAVPQLIISLAAHSGRHYWTSSSSRQLATGMCVPHSSQPSCPHGSVGRARNLAVVDSSPIHGRSSVSFSSIALEVFPCLALYSHVVN